MVLDAEKWDDRILCTPYLSFRSTRGGVVAMMTEHPCHDACCGAIRGRAAALKPVESKAYMNTILARPAAAPRCSQPNGYAC